MRQSLIAQRDVDVRERVELALEGAGYKVAGVVESTLTVETLRTTVNPVVVLLNEHASQCILVEVLPERSSPVLSLSMEDVPTAWQEGCQSLASLAIDGNSGAALEVDAHALRPAQASAPLASSARGAHVTLPRLKPRSAAQHVRDALVALKNTRIPIPVAVSHAAALAALGCLSGFLLRSWWSLVVVPAAYASGVMLRVVRGSWGAAEG